MSWEQYWERHGAGRAGQSGEWAAMPSLKSPWPVPRCSGPGVALQSCPESEVDLSPSPTHWMEAAPGRGVTSGEAGLRRDSAVSHQQSALQPWGSSEDSGQVRCSSESGPSTRPGTDLRLA